MRQGRSKRTSTRSAARSPSGTRRAFAAAGADAVVVHRELPDDTPFGTRLRRLVRDHGTGRDRRPGRGIRCRWPRDEDRRAFVDAARAAEPAALANNAFSADAVAIACAADALRDLPDDLASDNVLPRWLAEVAGVPVRDLRARRDLAFDVDTPLDVLLLATADRAAAGDPADLPSLPDGEVAAVRDRLAALRALASDPAAELLVAGRIAGADLRAIERGSRARTRVLIEERGLRTASLAAQRGRPNRRPPRSLLARLLERDGPERLGELVADHADGALIDTRVLLAARTGADEARLAVRRGPVRERPPAPGARRRPVAAGPHRGGGRGAGADPARGAHARRPGRGARARAPVRA